MLPPRSLRPHHPDECQACGPRGAGHRACQNESCTGRGENGGAGRAGTGEQTRRHATAAEYAALPPGLTPIDGVCHIAVFMCDDCADNTDTRFCEHPPVPTPPCPACGAADEDPCLKSDGTTPRTKGWHTGRQRPTVDVCRHAHREDCGIFEGCVCTADDQPPTRPARPAASGPGPDVSRLTIPPTKAQVLLAERGIAWERVKSVRSLFTQDTRPAIQAEVNQFDEAGILLRDEHGHEVVETVGPIPLDGILG